MLAEAGIQRAQVTGVTPLDGGTFNKVSRVALADGRRLVLKVPPSPDTPVLASSGGFCRPRRCSISWRRRTPGFPL